jgi:predicted dehydrogenase
VVGECGSIELDAGHSLRLFVDGRCTELPLNSGDDPLANEHDCFVARIRNSQAPLPVSMNDAIIGLKLAESILQSLASRREVAVSW